jgi:hypothetical protein
VLAQKYNELAAKDKIRYQKEAAQYKEDHPESSDEEEKPAKKKRKKKDPNAPKKPCSAFFHFSKKMRPRIKDENPEATFGQLGKIIGEQWSKLGADERKVQPSPPTSNPCRTIQFHLFIHSFHPRNSRPLLPLTRSDTRRR